jgi:hypothetical protein
MTREELNAHRGAVIAAYHTFQAGGEAPADFPTIGGVVVPVDQRAVVFEAIVQKRAWTADDANFIRACARLQLGV